jgi:hypothetical protein
MRAIFDIQITVYQCKRWANCRSRFAPPGHTNMNQLTSFFTTVLALSVASERTVEVLKGIFPFWPFRANANRSWEDQRVAVIHVLAGFCGGLASYFSRVDLLSYIHSTTPTSYTLPTKHGFAAFTMAALLNSAGSAFWNHALDILKPPRFNRNKPLLPRSLQTSPLGPLSIPR